MIQLSLLSPGDNFGDFGFFTNNPRQYTARSVNFVTLFYLTHKEFLNIMKDFPEDYVKNSF